MYFYSANFSCSAITGSLVIYCGGCGLALGEDIKDVPPKVLQATNGRPFIGTFTFGEQGTWVDAKKKDEQEGEEAVVACTSRHGNLMFSCAVFGCPRF